jgi:hypothetical protein
MAMQNFEDDELNDVKAPAPAPTHKPSGGSAASGQAEAGCLGRVRRGSPGP